MNVLSNANPVPSLVYNRHEAARRGGFSVRNLDRLVERRQVPFKRVGRRVLFPRQQFDDWCASPSLACRLGGVN